MSRGRIAGNGERKDSRTRAVTDCRTRVTKITLTVEPNNGLWGFPDMLDHMRDDSREDQIEAVIELVNEDFMAMFEDAVWEIEFSDGSKQ